MKKVLFLLSIIVGTVFSAPHNNPILQPSIWNGYGVDWCYSTLRVGLGNKDSLLEDGWALIDSAYIKYATLDSTYITNFGADTISTVYLYADTADISVATLDSIYSTIGSIDSLISAGANITLLTVSDSGYFAGNVFINDILFVDSIAGHSPIQILSPAIFDSVTTINDSLYVAGHATFGDTVHANTIVVDSNLVVTYAQSPIYKLDNGSILRNPSIGLVQFWNNAGKGYISFDGSALTIRQDSTLAPGANNITLAFKEEDNTIHSIYWDDTNSYFYTAETFRATNLWVTTNLYLGGGQIGVASILIEPAGNYWAGLCTVNSGYAGVLLDPNLGGQDTVQVGVSGDNDILHSECSENRFDADLKITDYSLTAGALVSETVDARPVEMQWTGQVTHEDLVAAASQEVVVIISGFPAKYKICEVLIDITEVFDDGVGAISACTISFGTAATPSSVLNNTDCYTEITQVGDSAGEVAFTSIQGGYRPSWSSNTDLVARFKTIGGNTVDLTTGIAKIYITYVAIE
jgi:hypothetical protein